MGDKAGIAPAVAICYLATERARDPLALFGIQPLGRDKRNPYAKIIHAQAFCLRALRNMGKG